MIALSRKWSNLWMVLALLTLSGEAGAKEPTARVTATYEQSLRGTLDGYPFMVLRGDHYQRGKAHGVLAGKEIVRLFNGTILPLLALQDRRLWDEQFVARTKNFSFPDRYEQELSGMLDGIKVALPDPQSRMLTALNRPLNQDDLKAINCISDLLRMGCSSFAAWGSRTAGGEVIVARNLDYMALPLAQSIVLLAIEPTEKDLKATLDINAFGGVGTTTAMNQEGVFAAIHDARGQRPLASSGWIPRTLAIRTALEQAGAAEPAVDMTRILQNVPVSVGTNLHVVGPRTDTPKALPGVLEWDSAAERNGVTLRRPHSPDSDEMICTNHYLARSGGSIFGSSLWRWQRLTGELERQAELSAPIDAGQAKRMLDQVSRNGGVVTHLSVVAWPQSRKMLIARSPILTVSATRGGWTEVNWKDLFDLQAADFPQQPSPVGTPAASQ